MAVVNEFRGRRNRLRSGGGAVPPRARFLALLFVVVCNAWPGPVCSQEPLFDVEAAFFFGVDTMKSIAFGDVDLDGDLDLVCGVDGDANTLFLNDGGVFEAVPAWSSDQANRTQSIALGDLDGDGYPDLVCGNRGQVNTLYLNQAGVFSRQPAWSTDVANQTAGVALGDVDNDGDLDLLCANNGQDNLLYRNLAGVPETSASLAFAPASSTVDLELADVDGDGDLDVLCGNINESNTLHVNEGGSWSAAPDWSSTDGNQTWSIAAGDIDGDGDLDLLCGNYGQSTVLYRNDHPDSIRVFTDLPVWETDAASKTKCLALGDVDRDGDLDLVCGNDEEANSVYLNDGGALEVVSAWSTTQLSSTLSVALGDVDLDGDLDLVFGNYFEGNPLYRNGGGPFAPAPTRYTIATCQTRSIAVGDMDGDGDPDVVCGNESQPNALMANDGGQLAEVPIWSADSPAFTQSVALADVDGNGFLDLVCGNLGIVSQLYLNHDGDLPGTPDWTTEIERDTRCVALGDIDGNGRPDLVCGNQGQPNVLYLNSGSGFADTTCWSSAGALATWSVALGDVDGDGDPDLVCGNAGQGNTMYLNQDGQLSTTPVWTSDFSDHFNRSVALADADGDGDLDLLCGNDASGNALYLNEGGTFSTTPVWLSELTNSTQDIALADVDGDGDLDLACANVLAAAGSDLNTLFENRGSESVFAASPMWETSVGEKTFALALADLDSDGDQDLLCGNYDESNTYYRNLRNPVFRGDPGAPSGQLVNNDAFLRDVEVEYLDTNLYRLSVTAVDVESDPVWIVAECQLRGESVWHSLDLSGIALRADGLTVAGPLSSSPAGDLHYFDWQVIGLPLSERGVELRLRCSSTPRRAGLVRYVANYSKSIDALLVERPAIAVAQSLLSFPTVTVGDTCSLDITVENRGNVVLSVASIDLPSTEMRQDTPLPLDIEPGRSAVVSVLLEPRTQTGISGDMVLYSNDPTAPAVVVRIETDIRPLSVTTRTLTAAPRVPLGEALTVLVTPAPQVVIESGFLYYRPGLEATAFRDSVVLAPSGDEFIAIVPGHAVTEADLEYYLKVANSGVYATDPPGAPDDAVFRQAVEAPTEIGTSPLPSYGNNFLAGREIAVQVILPGGAEFVDGDLFFRRGGEDGFLSTPLRMGDPLPFAVIPDTLVGARGIEYRVEVETLTSRLTVPDESSDRASLSIAAAVPDLQEATFTPAEQYRLVSIPLEFGADFTGTLEGLLFDQEEFGSYDPTRWRCFRYLPAVGDYAELSNEAHVADFRPEPGRSFWLVCRQRSRITTAPSIAFSTPTDSSCAVVVEPGWNQIGSPFAFAVAWDSVLVDGIPVAEADPPLFGPVIWNGSEYEFDYATVLEPFAGYWLRNNGENAAELRIPPRELVVDAPEEPAIESVPVDCRDWRIGITAVWRGVSSGRVFCGIADAAGDGWDRLDRLAPPPGPGTALSVYFPHEDWDRLSGPFTVDLRRPTDASSAGGHSWAFDLVKGAAEEGVGDEVSLEFAGLDTVAAEAVVTLVDRRLDRRVTLAAAGRIEATRYDFFEGRRGAVAGENETRFLLLAGSEEFVAGRIAELPGVPARTALFPNRPNPFNPATVIRYDLAATDRVSVRIYDLSGKLVRELESANLPAGRYEVVWRGNDRRGRRVAAAVYFVMLETAGGVREIRKITLVK